MSSNAYSPQDVLLTGSVPTVLGASVTNRVISKEIALTSGGSQNLRIDLKVSGFTLGAGITVKLQHKSIDSWSDLAGANASVAITANGEFSITQLMVRSADQPNMPIKKQVRVLVTTGAGSAVTVDAIRVSQPL
jgi:hypothetical protein